MAAGEVEGPPLQLEPKIKSKQEKYLLNSCCIAFNFIFPFIIIFLIVHAGTTNILSIYHDDTNGYLRCGWNKFCAHSCNYKFSCNTWRESWLQKYNDCILYKSSVNDCDSYKYPNISGMVWFYCNIISIISLLISGAGYIVIAYRKKYFKSKVKKLKEMLYFSIFFESFIPSLLLLIAIIYWFQTNSIHPGCWNDDYRYNDIIFTYYKLGESMVFDIIAVILIILHLMIHIHLLMNTKKRNIKKHKVPMLAAQINENEGVEGEGYPNQYIQNVRDLPAVSAVAIELQPIECKVNKMDYKSSKKWFDESVNIPNDINCKYKEIYYDKLIENGFDNFVAIKSINNQDLIDIGIDKLGHRRTILIAIQKL